MNREELWDLLVAKLGWNAIFKLNLHQSSTPEHWIAILCAAIMKEPPNVG